MCQSVRLKRLVGEEGWGGGVGGINIGLFWTLLLFYSVTLFHTHGGPAHFLTNPTLTALPGLPTAITYKNFSGPPHVVWFLKSCIPLLTWCGGY